MPTQQHADEQQDEQLARDLHRQRGEDGRADDDAERVGADQPARAGDRLLRVGRGQTRQQVAGEVRQQAHGHELGGADAEPAEGEGQQREPATGGREGRHGTTSGRSAGGVPVQDADEEVVADVRRLATDLGAAADSSRGSVTSRAPVAYPVTPEASGMTGGRTGGRRMTDRTGTPGRRRRGAAARGRRAAPACPVPRWTTPHRALAAAAPRRQPSRHGERDAPRRRPAHAPPDGDPEARAVAEPAAARRAGRDAVEG